MGVRGSIGEGRSRLVRAGWVGVALAALTVSACRNAPLADMTKLDTARAYTEDALLQFVKNVDAGDRAVMADTDDASKAFAHEAEEASHAVSLDIERLTPLVQELGYTNESTLLGEFSKKFAEHTAVEREILTLAVENTNLKAQQLSFGPAQREADAFRDALHAVAGDGHGAEDLRLQVAAANAVAAVREVQVLQAPHIAESDEDAMSQLEARTAAAEGDARRALAAIDTGLPSDAKPKLQQARQLLDRFMDINAQIVKLSRRNSNVRSLALSLGQRRTLAAACEDRLGQLRDGLARRGFAGTR